MGDEFYDDVVLDELKEFWQRKQQEYDCGELPLINEDIRIARGEGWWLDTKECEAFSSQYGIKAVLVDDGKNTRLKVNQELFKSFLKEELWPEQDTFFLRHVFSRLLWLCKYCEHYEIKIDRNQTGGLLYRAYNLLMLFHSKQELIDFKLIFRKWIDVFIHASVLNEDIDLLFADCVMRESVKATLEILKDEPDEEGILDRLNDKETDKLFSEVRERCNIVKAVKAMNETVKDAARAVDGNTASVEAMKETVEAVKEQMLEASHFPKTGIPLSLTDAADLLWAVFRDELQTLPQCESEPPEQLFSLGIHGNDTTNLRKFFERRTKEKELDSRKVEAKNNRKVIAYDMADYYELMLEKLSLSSQNHFREKATFEAIVKKLKKAHETKS